ncbi:DUF930 domain-containing protein [Xanthobacter autotrophicus]|uniref:DUF930 domain-containing protein n=1 Tax=Xanthobacter autotrophicus TaxID=280 RepID=UPI0024A74C04|nr:DUF930 domain-containing protein [Xanthobacter autotrophicus]MDI4657751.1 DUF930 domain-containing protein [Xanthobacter autotrophicus]
MKRLPFPAALLPALVALSLVAAPAAADTAHKRTHTKKSHSETAQPDTGQPKRDAAMLHVDLPTRIEQRCNARAMGMVGREHSDMQPEETVAYAFADPQLGEASITAPGAAIRSHGHWYHLSYTCHTSADGMDVESFSYTLGGDVPRDEWSTHSLVP